MIRDAFEFVSVGSSVIPEKMIDHDWIDARVLQAGIGFSNHALYLVAYTLNDFDRAASDLHLLLAEDLEWLSCRESAFRYRIDKAANNYSKSWLWTAFTRS